MYDDLEICLVDANVFVGITKRNLLLLANKYQLSDFRVSTAVIEEVRYTLERIRLKRKFTPDEAREKAEITIRGILSQFSAGRIVREVNETYFPEDLPDPKDRHVVEAALVCNADYIITDNVRDFPQSAISSFKFKVVTPDSYFSALFDKYPTKAFRILSELNQKLNDPALPFSTFIEKLENDIGLVETVRRFRTIGF